MDTTKPTYRSWESKWSPNNRAVREAQQIKASDRSRKRRQEREDLRTAALAAVRDNPELHAARKVAQGAAAAMTVAMSAPRRCTVIARPHCQVIPTPAR